MLDMLSRDELQADVFQPPHAITEGNVTTLSPEYYLHRQYKLDEEQLADQRAAIIKAAREAAYNALIPPTAIKVELQPWGMRYLHPRKGWKTVGKRRFAARGVL